MAAGSVVALLRNPQKKRCVYDFIPCYISCVFCLLVGLSCLIVLSQSQHTGVSCFLSWYLSYSGSITLHHSIIGNAIHTREESRKSLPRSTVVISSLQLPTIPSSLRGERVCCMSVCFTCIILGNLSHTTFHLVAYSSPLQVHRLLQAHCHMSYSAWKWWCYLGGQFGPIPCVGRGFQEDVSSSRGPSRDHQESPWHIWQLLVDECQKLLWYYWPVAHDGGLIAPMQVWRLSWPFLR